MANVRIVTTETAAHELRQPEDAGVAGNHAWLGVQLRGRTEFLGENGVTATDAGDVVFHNATSSTPHATFSEGHSALVLILPRFLLGRLQLRAEDPPIRVITPSPETSAVRELMLALRSSAAAGSGTVAIRLLMSTLDITTELIDRESWQVGDARLGNATAHLDDIKMYFLAHLGDPDLNIDAAARANFVSSRTLQRLFAAAGEHPAEWIRAQRLELARRELADPSQPESSISDIAARCGFRGQSHFGQVFAAAFGISPGRFRETFL